MVVSDYLHRVCGTNAEAEHRLGAFTSQMVALCLANANAKDWNALAQAISSSISIIQEANSKARWADFYADTPREAKGAGRGRGSGAGSSRDANVNSTTWADYHGSAARSRTPVKGKPHLAPDPVYRGSRTAGLGQAVQPCGYRDYREHAGQSHGAPAQAVQANANANADANLDPHVDLDPVHPTCVSYERRPRPCQALLNLFRSRGIPTGRYKFSICNKWARGANQCQFSHGAYGSAQCMFAHGPKDELRPTGPEVDAKFAVEMEQLRHALSREGNPRPNCESHDWP